MSGENFVSQAADDELSAPLASSEAVPASLSVGEQLRAAREARGMSESDVAKVLKLSVHQVIALEEGDWSRLPGTTIIRGFVRNYGRLLKLDTDSLMSALSATALPAAPNLDLPAGGKSTMPQAGGVERRDFATAFSGLVLVVLAVLAYFFIPQDLLQSKVLELMDSFKQPEAVVAKPDVSRVDPPVLAAPSGAVAAAEAPPQPGVPPGASGPAGVESQKVPAADASSGLKLIFAQPSWVEIRDRSGQIIFSQLNPAGSERDIEGHPPFALVVGNASNVTVKYKGQVVELSQRSKDDVARLNLD